MLQVKGEVECLGVTAKVMTSCLEHVDGRWTIPHIISTQVHQKSIPLQQHNNNYQIRNRIKPMDVSGFVTVGHVSTSLHCMQVQSKTTDLFILSDHDGWEAGGGVDWVVGVEIQTGVE